LPFVAEDLGDIDETVLGLRDQFHLPGMKVLQFAFGEDLPQSNYIPHNYASNFIVYTGTHDNNTTRGWFNKETTGAMKARIEAYVGKALSSAEIHIELARLSYTTVADIVIFPLQDVLGLDDKSRMSTPA